MRKTMFVSLIVLTFCLGLLAHAQPKSGANAAGTWAGTWTGGSTGKFEMTIKKDAKGKLSASLSATPDQGGGYTVEVKSVVAIGSKLTCKFEDPPGDVEVTLQAMIVGSSLKGDYSVRAKASGEEVEKGAVTASRKEVK
jgi:hypothetical protein